MHFRWEANFTHLYKHNLTQQDLMPLWEQNLLHTYSAGNWETQKKEYKFKLSKLVRNN